MAIAVGKGGDNSLYKKRKANGNRLCKNGNGKANVSRLYKTQMNDGFVKAKTETETP